MGIEESIERIVLALETIAEVQKHLLTIAEWNKARLGGEEPQPDRARGCDAAPEVRQPQQWTYEELKAELAKRGVEVAKGARMTTLLKFWELHKNDPEMQTAPAKEPEAPQTEQAPAAETPSAPAPSEDLFDGQEEPAPTPEPEVKPMTEIEARKHIMSKGYTGTPEQIALLKKALAAVGAAKFADVASVENGYGKLIAEFDRLTEEK